MKIEPGVRALGLSTAAYLCGILGMIILMASRRGGSLLTFSYFFYVFQYVCLISVPMAISQFLIHRFQFKKSMKAEWIGFVVVVYVVMQSVVGYLAALAFDF